MPHPIPVPVRQVIIQVATARKIAERVYRMLKFGQAYVRQSQEAYEKAYRLRLMKSLAKRAAHLGINWCPKP